MTDANLTVGADVVSTGGEDRLAAEIERALVNSARTAGRQISQILQRSFRSSADDAGKRMASGLKTATSASKTTAGSVRALQDRVSQLTRTQASFEQRARAAYDPGFLGAFSAQLESILEIQRRLDESAGNLDDNEFRELRAGLQASEESLRGLRGEFLQVEKTARDSERNQSRVTEAEIRDRAAARKAETSRYVVDTQRAAQQEALAVRTSSQQQVASIQAAARQRVAAMRFAGQAIRAIERGIRTVFQTTGRVIGSSFRSASRVASGAARSITRVFRRENTNITNDFSRSWRTRNDITNNSLQSQEREIRSFSERASGLLAGIGLGGALGLGGAAVGGAAVASTLRGGFERFSTIQDAQRGLEVLIGDAQEAETLLNRVEENLIGTPLRLDTFAEAASQLVGFNLEAEKVPDVLEAIGDAAAIRGSRAPEMVGRLVDIFGRIQSQGRVTLEEVNRLSDAGVPALQLLGNQLGLTALEAREFITEGELGAEAIDLLVDGIINGTEGVNDATAAFGGLAKSIGDTLRGSVSNLAAYRDILGAAIIEPFNDAGVAVINIFISMLQEITAVVEPFLQEFTSSPGFQAFVAGLEQISERIDGIFERNSETLRDFARSVGIVASAFAGLSIVRNASTLFAGFRFVLRRLLTPLNIALVALTGIQRGLRELFEQSPDLREALTSVFDAGLAALAPLGDALSAILEAVLDVGGSLREQLGAALEGVARFINNSVVPALENFADFIDDTIAPAIERFAGFIVDLVDFDVGSALADGFGLVVGALSSLADFITDTVIPVVLPVLRQIGDIAVASFEAIRDFILDSLLPALGSFGEEVVGIGSEILDTLPGAVVDLGSDLRQAFNDRSFSDALTAFGDFIDEIGVIAAVGIGGLALTFWNPLLGATIGVGALLAGIWGDDIRDAVLPAVRNVRDAIVDFFTVDNLASIGINILSVIERVGRELANIVSDPTFLGIVAGFAAAAVAAVTAFVAGFARGLIENIPEIAEALQSAFETALDSALSALVGNPRLLATLAGVFTAGAFLSRLRQAGRVGGQAVATGMSQGVASGTGALGAGVGSRGFLTGLFGGEAALRRDATRVGTTAGRAIGGALQREMSLLGTAGRPFRSVLPRGQIGPVLPARQLQEARTQVQNLESDLGAAGTAGLRLRDGISQIGRGRFRPGFAQIRETLSGNLRPIAAGAGVAAGGVLMSSMSAQMLLEADTVGQGLQGALGIAASGLTTGALIGGLPGVVAGLATALGGLGIAAFSSSLGDNVVAARDASDAVNIYADAVRDAQEAGRDASESIEENLVNAFDDFDLPLMRLLDDAGFSASELVESARNGGDAVNDLIRDIVDQVPGGIQAFELLREGGNSVGEAIRAISGDTGISVEGLGSEAQGDLAGFVRLARSSFDELGISGDEFLSLILTLQTEFGAIPDGLEADDIRGRFLGGNEEIRNMVGRAGSLGEAFSRAQNRLGGVRREAQQTRIDRLAGDAERFRDELELFREDYIASVREDVGEAEQALSEAETAANNAREAVLNFLQPKLDDFDTAFASAAGTVQRTIDSINEKELIDSDNFFDEQELNTELAGIQSALEEAVRGMVNSDDLDVEALVTRLGELAGAAGDVGGDAGERIQGEIEDFIEQIKDPEFTGRVEDLEVADEAVEDAQALLDEKELELEFILTFDEEIARGASRDAATEAATEATAQKHLFNTAGENWGDGLTEGVRSRRRAAVLAAEETARQVEAVLDDIFEFGSPSRVTFRMGANVTQGLADGMISRTATASAGGIRIGNAAVAAAEQASQAASRVGKNIATAIGEGLAEGGPEVINSITSIIDRAITEGLTAAQQSQAIGSQIALGLFQQQGVGTGPLAGPGGGVEAALQLAFIDIAGLPGRFAEQTAGILEEFEAEGGSFSLGSDMGRQLREAFLSGGIDIRNYAEELIAAGKPLSQVAFETKAWRDNLIEAAKAQGATAAEIDEMIQQLGLSDSQLAEFIATVERLREEAEEAKQVAEDEAAAEEAAAEAEEEDQATPPEPDEPDEEEEPPTVFPPPIFNDLIIQTPSGDPEAVALAVANKVAYNTRR